MRKRLLFLAGAFCVAVLGQDRNVRLRTYFDAQCKDNAFMGAVAMKQRGTTVFEAACGVANVERRQRDTVDTRFRAASISKQFTATAILLLQQEGKLSVDDPIGSYVDDLPGRGGRPRSISSSRTRRESRAIPPTRTILNCSA